MICNKLIDATHKVKTDNRYLVDTNVLLYLYGDSLLVTENENLRIQARVFNAALDCGCDVFVPSTVISEFINKYHRLEANNLRKTFKRYQQFDYKRDYRNTKRFNENNKFIIDTVKLTILSRCKMIEDKFLDEYREELFDINEGQDFNDVLIINIANQNDLYVITADKDFYEK